MWLYILGEFFLGLVKIEPISRRFEITKKPEGIIFGFGDPDCKFLKFAGF
jgi:hypothetical protein